MRLEVLAEQVQRGVAVLILHVHIGPVSDQQPHDVDMTVEAGPVKRSGSGNILRIHVNTMSDQQSYNIDVVSPAVQVKRSLSVIVPRVHVGSAVNQQPRDREPLIVRRRGEVRSLRYRRPG